MTGFNTPSAHAIVADTDPASAKLLRAAFEDAGFTVLHAQSAAALRSLLDTQGVCLVTLDLKIGHDDGLDVIRAIRQSSDVAIIVVTVRASKVSLAVALEVGADDYVTKPFDADELVARARAILRRTRRAPPATGFAETQVPMKSPESVFYFDDWRFDVGGHRLWSPKGTPVELTGAEIALLSIFVNNPRKTLGRAEIASQLRGTDNTSTDRSIDVLVGRLRRKLDKHAGGVEIIKTRRGAGYLFCIEVKRGTAR